MAVSGAYITLYPCMMPPRCAGGGGPQDTFILEDDKAEHNTRVGGDSGTEQIQYEISRFVARTYFKRLLTSHYHCNLLYCGNIMDIYRS